MQVHTCSICGAPATKWDGGIDGHVVSKDGLKKLPRQYRCDACDPYNKWFALETEQE